MKQVDYVPPFPSCFSERVAVPAGERLDFGKWNEKKWDRKTEK
jgi:hypothetical protein